MNILKSSILILLLAGLLAGIQNAAPEVRTEKRKTSKGSAYTIFYPRNLIIQVVSRRPNMADKNCLLSVAGAYTDLKTNQPLDLLLDNGRILQPKAKVGFLDGMLTIIGNTLTITRIPKGQSPSAAQLEKVRSQQGTLLLQELLVFQGKNQRGAGGSDFQRRALVEFADHRFAVVESTSDYTKMKQFADDLIELGARNALYPRPPGGRPFFTPRSTSRIEFSVSFNPTRSDDGLE